jgi:hypothetical protein
MKVNFMCIFIDTVLVIDILCVTLNKSVSKRKLCSIVFDYGPVGLMLRIQSQAWVELFLSHPT